MMQTRFGNLVLAILLLGAGRAASAQITGSAMPDAKSGIAADNATAGWRPILVFGGPVAVIGGFAFLAWGSMNRRRGALPAASRQFTGALPAAHLQPVNPVDRPLDRDVADYRLPELAAPPSPAAIPAESLELARRRAQGGFDDA